MKSNYVLPLAEASVVLETVGGKGLSLARMIQAGFPVPDGFHITTEAYRLFVSINGLQPRILAALKDVDIASPASLETASAMIEGLFVDAAIPAELIAPILAAYLSLTARHRVPVAIRSSATAEDLPGASFAGQQETFLNIRGSTAVLDAVKKCWASLWTARAITYRIHNRIAQDTVALAVVVQEMVNAEAAGILFTANPVTGCRAEMVINAAWGLGEAVVGGLVSPDTIIADKSTGRVIKLVVAEKTLLTVPADTGTREQPLEDARRTAQVMTDAQVIDLVGIARRIEDFYGSPQDIEWCLAKEYFHIVQSRPVTALPEPELPAPTAWKLPRGAYAAMRNNIVELMTAPLSPLFATLGLSAVNASLTRLLRESFAMRGIMPEDIVIVVNQYAYNNGSASLGGILRMLFGIRKILKKMFTGAVERWTETGRPRYTRTLETWESRDWRSLQSVELVESARQLTESAIDAYGALISGLIPAAWITEALFTKLYDRLIRRRGDPAAPVYLLGFDSLPIQSDKALYRLAEWARQQPVLADWLKRTSTSELKAALNESGTTPADIPPDTWQEWRCRFHEHLQNYGHTLYDLDFASPLPVDDPAPLLDAFRLYLRGGGVDPLARQQDSVHQREQAEQNITQRLKGLRLKLFSKYLAAARKYAPLREDGLAEIGLAYPLIRQMLLELGCRFTRSSVLPAAQDIFWLTQAEVLHVAERLDAGQTAETLKARIAQRRAEYNAALRANPPMMLPQMKVFGFDLMSLKDKRGRSSKGNVVRGVAASPGKVTAAACVLHGPAEFGKMNPGDVLVASITTPAWTPLFAMASAVVTDVGGPLSHGSIVAREYGIPAVLGTGVATRRIQDGQVVTVNGSAGTVVLLSEDHEA